MLPHLLPVPSMRPRRQNWLIMTLARRSVVLPHLTRITVIRPDYATRISSEHCGATPQSPLINATNRAQTPTTPQAPNTMTMQLQHRRLRPTIRTIIVNGLLQLAPCFWTDPPLTDKIEQNQNERRQQILQTQPKPSGLSKHSNPYTRHNVSCRKQHPGLKEVASLIKITRRRRRKVIEQTVSQP